MGQEDQEEIDRSIAEAYEAAEFIKTFVVQAKLNERGNFGKLSLGPHSHSVYIPLDIHGTPPLPWWSSSGVMR